MSTQEADIVLVLLPNCGAFMPNLGLASVKAALGRAGYSARILDLDYSFAGQLASAVAPDRLPLLREVERWVGYESFNAFLPDIEELIQECVKRIAESKAKVIGFSVSSFNYACTDEVIGRLRRMGDRRPIILGGSCCYVPESIFGLCKQVDAVVLGEVDESIGDFMAWFLAGRAGEPPEGTLLLNEQGAAMWKLRAPPEDLSRLPVPDYDGQEWPGHWNYREFPILLSRGCVGRCAFCDVFARNGRFRTRKPEQVVDEVAGLLERYAGLRLHFNDSLVNGSLQVLRRFCEILAARGLHVPMIGQARARRDMTAEDFALMRQAGFVSVIYGIETGSEKVRQLMNKTQGATLDEVATCLARTHDAGLRVGVNLIVGFPGESRRELEESAEFVIRNRSHIDYIASISCMGILPQSPVYCEPERFGVDPEAMSPDHWRTLDGSNTFDERSRRRKWLHDELAGYGLEMSALLADLEAPSAPAGLVTRVSRKAKSILAKLDLLRSP